MPTIQFSIWHGLALVSELAGLAGIRWGMLKTAGNGDDDHL